MAWTTAVSGRRSRRRGVDSCRFCGDQQHSVDQQLVLIEIFEIVCELTSDLRDKTRVVLESSGRVLRRGFESSSGKHAGYKEFRLVAKLLHFLNVVCKTFSIRQAGV